ncbi:hypothetical protein ES703_15147 [subsurface metagenome]
MNSNMIEYYLAKKRDGHPDSPHIGKIVMLAVSEEGNVSFHRGRINDKFELNEEGKLICVTNMYYEIHGPLAGKELANLLKRPFDSWGDLTIPKRIYPIREIRRRGEF